MKILLFVQNGDRRPVSLNGHPSVEEVTRPTSIWSAIASRSDRWWLVECKNAEAGRKLISDGSPQTMSDLGRILASGGVPSVEAGEDKP